MLMAGAVLAAVGCGNGATGGSRSKAVDREIEAAATSRRAQLQLAYTSLAKAPRNLPTCTPKADITVLPAALVNLILTG